VRAVAFESPATGERLEVDLPLGCRRDPAELRDELGLPGYVDVREPHVARAVAVLWAARNAPELAEGDARLAGIAEPLRVATFGGVAFRLLSPSANDPQLARRIGDLDLICAKTDASKVVRLLTILGDVLGSRFWHAVTKSDEMFNNLRGGQRYRVHALEEDVAAENGIASTSLDLFVDRLGLCHEIPLEAALQASHDQRFTIGGAELLLTKLQYIRAMHPSEVTAEHEYRVIGELGKTRLIGLEDKDLWDCACLLADREVGAEIDAGLLAARLTADWALARTVRLNARNATALDHVLAGRPVDEPFRDRARAGLARVAEIADEAVERARVPRLRLSKRWWEEVEDA
jgi:hypothetical protein